ncbi:uncharacterized protein LTR77_000842 [Saxophila tyrrhenica]|uniref:Uncharacterized protein n=1 Tax=Saxophila tyrrhenica TaxID=1690608 RepID=A0AAV9PTQ4_9PEZI|nr:hypothetical protein LTR77_000842 [Saxophila tyrrhenica]
MDESLRLLTCVLIGSPRVGQDERTGPRTRAEEDREDQEHGDDEARLLMFVAAPLRSGGYLAGLMHLPMTLCRRSEVENPFASPFISTHTLPAPPPCAQRSHDYRMPQAAVVIGNLDKASYDSSTYTSQYYPADPECKSGSMSSTMASSIMTPSSVNMEKGAVPEEEGPRQSSRESRRSGGNRDPEKGTRHSSRHGSHQSNRVDKTIAMEEEDEEVDEGRAMQEQHAVKILLFLSGPAVILSAINTVWAVIALVITALSQSIRICARRPSFGQQLAGLLGPTLNLQLRSIYTPLPPHANEDGSYHDATLFMVHILSPFMSFVIMFAAWVLGFYWLASGMVGDPAGQDKRDDGKETVLGLRNFWEGWLMRSVKEE